MKTAKEKVKWQWSNQFLGKEICPLSICWPEVCHMWPLLWWGIGPIFVGVKLKWSQFSQSLFFFPRGMGREGETSIKFLPYAPGQGFEPWPFGVQDDAQKTEPHWPRLKRLLTVVVHTLVSRVVTIIGNNCSHFEAQMRLRLRMVIL